MQLYFRLLVSSSLFRNTMCVSAAIDEGNWQILEPVMMVEVTAPDEFLGSILATLQRRHAIIIAQDAIDGYVTVHCEVSASICPNLFLKCPYLRKP